MAKVTVAQNRNDGLKIEGSDPIGCHIAPTGCVGRKNPIISINC